MKANPTIEWEQSEPGYFLSMCGRFCLSRDATYDVYHLHSEETGHYIAEGSMSEMTRAAAAYRSPEIA